MDRRKGWAGLEDGRRSLLVASREGSPGSTLPMPAHGWQRPRMHSQQQNHLRLNVHLPWFHEKDDPPVLGVENFQAISAATTGLAYTPNPDMCTEVNRDKMGISVAIDNKF